MMSRTHRHTLFYIVSKCRYFLHPVRMSETLLPIFVHLHRPQIQQNHFFVCLKPISHFFKLLLNIFKMIPITEIGKLSEQIHMNVFDGICFSLVYITFNLCKPMLKLSFMLLYIFNFSMHFSVVSEYVLPAAKKIFDSTKKFIKSFNIEIQTNIHIHFPQQIFDDIHIS